MRYPDTEVTSVSDLIAALARNTQDLHEPVWYRGQPDTTMRLLPEQCRAACKSEIECLKQFKQDATLLLDPVPVKPWDWLFIMRHHGVPTRLLDWSESPLVAAYFVVADAVHLPRPGALWALLPIKLNSVNRQTADTTLPTFAEDQFMELYSPDSYERELHTQMQPVAFLAPRNTPRMRSQLSVFTIHHRLPTPIEELGDASHVWRYVIPAAAKAGIRAELEMLRIGKFQLFPELEKLGDIISGR